MQLFASARAMLACAAACTVLISNPLPAATRDSLSLAGRWRFELDRANEGLQERWFENTLSRTVRLPGSLPAQGIGDEVTPQTKWIGGIVDNSWFTAPEYEPYRKAGNVKIPFWLQPETYYAGPAWYQREIEIPEAWRGKRVVLSLERPHWETRVWLDSVELGANQRLSTPHEYVLSTHATPGKHRLTIRVDNSLVVDVGINSHCVSDHTQGNWNGIVGEIQLSATTPVWIDDLQVYPSLADKKVIVRGTLGNTTGAEGSASLSLRVQPASRKGAAESAQRQVDVPWGAVGATKFELELPVPGAKDWSEFSPELYTLEARLADGVPKVVQFGFRDLAVQGTQFLLNGQKTFIRGTLECCIFPLTGHPPVDEASWEKVIRAAKAHGLNLLRFHSYCPPEAAFSAADRLGMYLQVETCWPNQSTTIGDGKAVDRWVYDETDWILQAYGNHPSFLFMLHGNEPGGKNANAYLAKYLEHYKARDPRRLWSSGAGWPQLAQNQFHVTPDPRIQAWGGGLKSRINALPPETVTDYRDYVSQRNVPVISHEIGQWCVYPNFDEIRKYKGYLKPRNFEIFRDSLEAHGMGGLARKFLLASGKLQTLCYKEDIESALRTPGMAGFQLLDLHDFPGQGTALVGVLDPFWESKGYVSASEYRRFCNSTVPLARLRRRVFTTAETLEASLEVAHFGPEPLRDASVDWKLVTERGQAIARGSLPGRQVELGNGIRLGTITVQLGRCPAPAKCTLVVSIKDGSSRQAPTFENDWDLWVYPDRPAAEPPGDLLVIRELDDQAVAALNAGGKALLLIPPSRVKGDRLGKVELGFSSIFWNTAWTSRQPPHTLGIMCDPKTPALADFPTDYHSNWQWWYLVRHAGALILDDLPPELRPTVQVIDDWVTNRKLGLLFEARLGAGKLMVCSIDLPSQTEENPVARQFMASLYNYISGTKFRPEVSLTAAQVRALVNDGK